MCLSPTSVLYHPTMAFPRRDWIVYHNGMPVVIDLYATRNMLELRKQRYQLSVAHWEICNAFMEDLRFTESVNMRTWNAIPRLDDRFTDFLMGEEWLVAYGVRGEPIDFDAFVNLADSDDDESLEDAMFENLEEIDEEIHSFFSRLLDD